MGGGGRGEDVFDVCDQDFPLIQQAHRSLQDEQALASVERIGVFSSG